MVAATFACPPGDGVEDHSTLFSLRTLASFYLVLCFVSLLRLTGYLADRTVMTGLLHRQPNQQVSQLADVRQITLNGSK